MKKINLLKVLAIAVCCSTLFIACKKDETDNTPDKVKKLMYNWKITGISVPKTTQPATDSSLLLPCMTDDLIKFNTAGFDFQDGTTKCDSTIFHYAKGAWQYDLAADSIKMSATNPVKYVSWKVITLNDSILKVKFIDSINPANRLTKTVSFKH